jgi:NAD(P)-dependent dehydrogenase (short-subunit alcohol dehydrogenase family)
MGTVRPLSWGDQQRQRAALPVRRNISVNNLAPGPMDTSFFCPAEDDGAVAFHKSSAMNGELTKIEDIVPWVRHLLTDGWWANGRTMFLNGGCTTR